MSKIKIGVVEDEVIIAESICAVLHQLGYETCEPSTTYSEAIEMIETEKPDLLIIDILLAGSKDGIHLAGEIKTRFDLPFIFLTANSDRATVERAKTVEPPAYLVKPFNRSELYASIEICFSNYARTKQKQPEVVPASDNFFVNDAIFIKDGYSFVKVFLNDIFYLQSDHVYVKVVTKDREFLVRSSLLHYGQHFNRQKFFRIGKSHIVNVDHIQKLDGASVTINGQVLPMAKQFKDELMKHLRLA